MLADFCTAYGARSAGLRWPGDGPAAWSSETGPAPKGATQWTVPLPELPAGALWVDGTRTDDGFVQLAANALGASPALKRFLGPVADQARIAQRLEDAAKVAGRVAHDLDNVFQGVTGFLALAAEDLMPGSPAHDNVREADTAARAGMKFCVQLHQLSRGGQARPLPASVQHGRWPARWPGWRTDRPAAKVAGGRPGRPAAGGRRGERAADDPGPPARQRGRGGAEGRAGEGDGPAGGIGPGRIAGVPRPPGRRPARRGAGGGRGARD